MKVDVKNFDGATVEEFELRDDIFGIEPNTVVMHQALVRLGFRAIRAKGGRRESDFVRLFDDLKSEVRGPSGIGKRVRGALDTETEKLTFL